MYFFLSLQNGVAIFVSMVLYYFPLRNNCCYYFWLCFRFLFVSAAVEKSARAAGMSSAIAEQYAQQLLSSTPPLPQACVYFLFLSSLSDPFTYYWQDVHSTYALFKLLGRF